MTRRASPGAGARVEAMLERLALRVLPSPLRTRLAPVGRRLRGVLSGEADEARAQRMALVVFATRIFGAALAFSSREFLST